ncbi:MAG: translation initiation factor 2 [Euryarchaeota archaeon]|nr:translation initiation factor 2 [Euryarchaeota archaeon]
METMVSVGNDSKVMSEIVTAFVRNRGAVLLTQPADSEHDRWDGLSAPSEGDSATLAAQARRIVRGATGLSSLTLAYAGESFTVGEGGERTIHPVLFDTPTREIGDLEGVEAVEWVPPTAIRDRETVPGLWAAYEQVAPSPTTIAADTVHGAAALSIRALEVLRDRAAVVDEFEELVETALELQDARPSMAVLENRLNRVMSGADRSPQAVHDRAIEEIGAALDADATAAATAADRLDGPIATLSWSGTVRDALAELGEPVTVAESRPDREGIDHAESLASEGVDVTVTTDAALPAVLSDREFGAVLVGADTILPNGDIVNKVGTRMLALAADRADVPVYVVAARDKVATDDTFHSEEGPAAAVYDGEASIGVRNPIFDLTPGDHVTGVLTEDGLLDQRGISVVAAQHRSNAEWVDAL